MKNLTLKQLRYFDALARHRHFGRAAEASAVTQPALSMQIRELEEGLGLSLIDRSGREMRLTSFGEAFLSHVRDILSRVDGLEDLARAATGRPSGPLRIGIIPTAAPYLLPGIIARLSERWPELQPVLRETVTPRLLSELTEGRLDTAIVALPISQPGFVTLELFEEEFMLVRPLGDAQKPVPSPHMLREMRLLLLEEGHCFRDQALSFCALDDLRPRELLDGSSLSTLVQMVGAGIGVTLIPEMAVPVETRAAQVAVARFRAPPPSRRIGMIWRSGTALEPQLMQIAEEVREAARSLFAPLRTE